jgi:hypothetical protein
MLTALSAEMTADTVTISETAASFPENGLFYFLNQINAAASTIPTAGSPTYTDATYVTESIL